MFLPPNPRDVRRRLSRAVSFRRTVPSALFSLALVLSAHSALAVAADGAAAAPAPAPDVVVFTNGDQLTGKLVSAANGTVTFHSDVVGNVTVTWDKIKTLHSSQQFAVVQQGQTVSRKTPSAAVPQGTVAVDNQQLQVTPAAGAAQKEIPAKNAQYVIDEDSFKKQLWGHPGITQGWTGSATFGVALVEATQNSRSFNTAVNAVRAVPNASWLATRERTTLGFTDVYGSLSQPGTPTTKTSVLNASGEQDWYFSPRFYGLATAVFSHDYSQGLDLQQIYGGGAGYTVIKNARQELDLKTDVHYERQNFGATPGIEPPVITPSVNLIGMDFGDTYTLKLPHGMGFNQGLVFTPAFNEAKAFSAVLNAAVTFPSYKRFSFSLSTLDNYLNDPAYGSKKNSFQFTGGITYSF
jgi:hypothetical protein